MNENNLRRSRMARKIGFYLEDAMRELDVLADIEGKTLDPEIIELVNEAYRRLGEKFQL